MKVWSQWLSDLQLHLPACPVPTLENALLNACQDFFSRTRAWKVIRDPVQILAGQASVVIDVADADLELVRLEGGWLDGIRLKLYSLGDIDAAFTDDWRTHTGSVSTVIQETPGTILLYPIPVSDSSIGLKLNLSVMPSDAATGIPDDLYVKFKQAITSGALSMLMLIPDCPWTNPGLAGVHATSFDLAINAATLAAARSYGGGRISSRPKFV